MLPLFLLQSWLEYLNCNEARLIDLIDIMHASAARDAECHDSNFSNYFWNVSQNVTKEKHRTATSGIASCLSPGGDFLLPNHGRPLLGCEKLLLQGIPYFRLALGNETEVQLGDLAGNAMSLTVICATMLAAICAPQLREDIRAMGDLVMDETSMKRKSTAGGSNYVNQESLLKYLREHATLDANSSSHQRRWTGEIPTEALCSSALHRGNNGVSSLSFLRQLAELAPRAVDSSIQCTCESSGSNSTTNQFLRCVVCDVSFCRQCIHAHAGYNISSHETEEIDIDGGNSSESTENVRHTGAFQTRLRKILPPSLFFPKESISTIASVKDDCYRVVGLDKFTFKLHRIKRDRGKWLVIYYARDNNGVGEAVAEVRISVGKIERAQDSLGVVAELTSFMPARTEPLQYGKLDPCCRIVIPQNASPENLKWHLKMPDEKAIIQLSGQGSTPSFRVEVGLRDVAANALEEYTNRKAIKKAFEAAKERGEERRWLYPRNWKEWPETFRIRCFDTGALDDRVPGIYKRAKCKQTVNQSALWIKETKSQNDGTAPRKLYLLMKPCVARTGSDWGIISTSIDFNDAPSILAELDPHWQPCDALVAEHQRQVVICHTWKPEDSITCMVSESTMQVSYGKNDQSLAVISGLQETDVSMMSRGRDDIVMKLNVFSGQEGQQIVRVINSTVVAPVLKFVSTNGLKYDLSPQADWKPLKPPPELQFGSCEKTIPKRPTETWFFDEEKGLWERSSDPGASRKYYLEVSCAVSCQSIFETLNFSHHTVNLYATAARSTKGL